MGIAIPRPQMRSKERRVLHWSLRRHAELMAQFEAEGLDHAAASSKAYKIVKIEKPPREALRPNG